DVLALGMLTCIRRAFDLIERHYGRRYDLAGIPPERPEVYEMLSRADSLGVFQVESRAQMTMLPRLKPEKFYDLVIEVAIVRPGPIQGDMVHPYLRRRSGREPVEYPSEDLRRVLGKTLGVPLFQEQAMKIAIVGAGFAPEEADRLRRAMATFKRNGDIHLFREKFVAGMLQNGYTADFATRCFDQIEGFGTYGFPESHAASFALLVYVSAWIKCFYPDVFACALLNSQPMGFYAPAQIVRDAREHGVEVRPPDVNFSHWDCTLEPPAPSPPDQVRGRLCPSPRKRGEGTRRRARDRISPTIPGGATALPLPAGGERAGVRGAAAPGGGMALRLGLRQVKGLAEADAARLVAARGEGYRDSRDLWRKSGLGRAALERLAAADALRSLALDRRQGLWALKALGEAPLPLFAAAEPETAKFSLSPSGGEGWGEGARRRSSQQPPSPCPLPPTWGEGVLGAGAGDGQQGLAASLLPEMPLGEHVVEDYGTLGLTLKRHPLAFLREQLARQGLVRAADLATLPVGGRVAIAGLVLIRQRPGSANGVVFVTLEDETGIANLIVWPGTLERFRRAALGATLLYCRGPLQREESVIHIVAEDLRDWTGRLNTLRERTGRDRTGDITPSHNPGAGAPAILIPSRDFR
ncbi:MAG TPA: OB-fold nucleic acid binding domain-containing protein, partial [Stellaceae bacterium]|nr:OB-fold nucleic acid binding domain-containing protein [Stellaceae bacterium]